MKFGNYLQEVIVPEWRFYYIDYERLKATLKERATKGSYYFEKDEAEFVDALEKEMRKVL